MDFNRANDLSPFSSLVLPPPASLSAGFGRNHVRDHHHLNLIMAGGVPFSPNSTTQIAISNLPWAHQNSP